MDQFLIFITHHWLLWLVFAVIIGLLLGLELSSQLSGIPQLTPQQTVDLINHADAVVIDVRDKSEFDESHIANSVNFTIQELAQGSSRLDPYQSKPIIVVCRKGISSQAAVVHLRKKSFSNINNLKGGVTAWRHANLPLVKS